MTIVYFCAASSLSHNKTELSVAGWLQREKDGEIERGRERERNRERESERERDRPTGFQQVVNLIELFSFRQSPSSKNAKIVC